MKKLFLEDGNEILCFDPSQLTVFDTDNQNEIDYEELNKNLHIFDDDGPDLELIKANEQMKKHHILHCYQDKILWCKNKKYVYLAGKIEKNGWRDEIVGYRCNHLYGYDISKREELLNYYVEYNNSTTITGPWFLSCDHGCYHGDNCHGLGVLNVWGCPEAEGNNYSEDEVYKICTKQIDHSNIIFAYIYDNTCYGSIYEIAYAKAKGKKVIIIFDTEERMQDMWFMCQGADYVDVLRDESIGHKFNEIMSCVRVINR